MHPDQNNTQIIKNYVAMPDKPMFCVNDVANITGVKAKTVRNVMAELAKRGEVVALNKRIDGRVYYRTATEHDKMMADKSIKTVAQMAQERGISRQWMSQILGAHGFKNNNERLTLRQLQALMRIADGKPRYGYDVIDGQAIKACAKKGYATVNRAGRFNIYQITHKGQEVINVAKS